MQVSTHTLAGAGDALPCKMQQVIR